MGAQAAQVLEALDGAGIARDAVRTAGLDLRPVREDMAGQPPGTGRIARFEAETWLSVTLTDLKDLGAVLDGVLEAGATRVGGVTFALADPGAALGAARADAVRDARARAQTYAEAAGVALGPVLRITDAPGGQAGPQGARMMADAAAPVRPGRLRLSAQVTVVFAIGG